MDTMKAVQSALKELILPELGKIREENIRIRTTLESTNKRLDDVNLHLVDQSRRIDETNKRIDETRTELIQKIDETRAELKEEIWKNTERIDANNIKLDKNNARMDQLFQAIVRREEQEKLEGRVLHLEEEVKDLKMKLAA